MDQRNIVAIASCVALAGLAGAGCASLLGIDEPGAAGAIDAAGDASGDDAGPLAPDADAGVAIDAAERVDGKDCAEVHLRLPAEPSGVYSVDPDEDGAAPPFNVHCDMTFAGGGWTLALAYAHQGGTDPSLRPGLAPEDPEAGFSHMSAAQLAGFDFDQVRFVCRSDAHGRRMDFRTSDGVAVGYVQGVRDNLTSAWSSGFQTPAEHTSKLPGIADSARSCPQTGVCAFEDRLTSRPFFADGVAHWSIGAGGTWECDDAPGNAAATTLHQVWIR